MNRFIDERKDNWQRLEELLESLSNGVRLNGLSKLEVREFGELYRRAAADLAIARAETRDPKLINYLNSLVIRAHGKIYRSESNGFSVLANFFVRDFPQTFRKNWKYIALAGATFFVFLIFGFIATWINIDFTHFVGLSGIPDQVKAGNHWWLQLNEANQVGATFILSNNIIVSIRAFAMGALFGIGAFYDIAFFGAHVGSAFAACYSLDAAFGNDFAGFVIGHGVIEISTVFFCSGAGMMIGYAIVDPGDLTRAEALKKKGVEAAKIVIGSACLLVVAGLIEGFISPSSLPVVIKVIVGVASGVAMYSYLFFVGVEGPVESVAVDAPTGVLSIVRP